MKKMAMCLGCGVIAFAIGCGDGAPDKEKAIAPPAAESDKAYQEMMNKVSETPPGTEPDKVDAAATDKPAGDDKPAADDKPKEDK